MSNVNSPFGLRAVRKVDGTAPNYAVVKRQILYSDPTAIGQGDLVIDAGSGYLQKGVYNDTNSDFYGVFDSCQYYDTVQAKTIFSNQWPASGTALTGSVFANIIVDTDLIFEVQSSGGTGVTLAQIGLNATFVAAPTVATTGLSTLALDETSIQTTSTLPLRITGLSERFNNDNTSEYNIVEVILNASAFNNRTGI